MVKGKKQKRGDLVRIDIGGGKHFHAIALTPPLFAFLEDPREHYEAVADVRHGAVIFKVCVTDGAVKSGRWPVIGSIDLATVSALDGATFFKQDRISGRLAAYDAISGRETSISFDEADRLECAAVWSAEHIEDRLRDHLNGVPNKWWASMRPRRLPASASAQ
jgi:hypothetical protein